MRSVVSVFPSEKPSALDVGCGHAPCESSSRKEHSLEGNPPRWKATHRDTRPKELTTPIVTYVLPYKPPMEVVLNVVAYADRGRQPPSNLSGTRRIA